MLLENGQRQRWPKTQYKFEEIPTERMGAEAQYSKRLIGFPIAIGRRQSRADHNTISVLFNIEDSSVGWRH